MKYRIYHAPLSQSNRWYFSGWW